MLQILQTDYVKRINLVARVNAIADRYSDALFKSAHSENVIESVSDDCENLLAAIKEDQKLRSILKSKLISKNNFIKSFKEINEKFGLNKVTGDFLCLTAKNRRQDSLCDIFDMFLIRVKNHLGQKDAIITSATPITDSQRNRIKSILKNKTNSKIILKENIDSNLIGGIVIRIGSLEMDYSIKTKLNGIQQSLESLR